MNYSVLLALAGLVAGGYARYPAPEVSPNSRCIDAIRVSTVAPVTLVAGSPIPTQVLVPRLEVAVKCPPHLSHRSTVVIPHPQYRQSSNDISGPPPTRYDINYPESYSPHHEAPHYNAPPHHSQHMASPPCPTCPPPPCPTCPPPPCPTGPPAPCPTCPPHQSHRSNVVNPHQQYRLFSKDISGPPPTRHEINYPESYSPHHEAPHYNAPPHHSQHVAPPPCPTCPPPPCPTCPPQHSSPRSPHHSSAPPSHHQHSAPPSPKQHNSAPQHYHHNPQSQHSAAPCLTCPPQHHSAQLCPTCPPQHQDHYYQ